MKNKSLTKKQKIFLVLTLLWMGVIFAFSATPGDGSSEQSHAVGRAFGEIFVPGYRNWPYDERETFAAKIDHPVRKAAHMTEYAILSIFLFNTLVPAALNQSLPDRQKNHPLPNTSANSLVHDEADSIFDSSKKDAPFRTKHPYISSLIFSEIIIFSYASTDEFHQLFVPGRAGQFTDILIDSAGALIGLTITVIFFNIKLHFKKKSAV